MEIEEVLSGIAIVLAIIALVFSGYVYTNVEEPQELDTAALDANILFLQSRVSSLEGASAPTCSCQIDGDDLDDVQDDVKDLENNIEDCADDSIDFDELVSCLSSI